MIIVENKKKSIDRLINNYPNSEIIDITSKGQEPFVKFSPFYPHGNIPIPYSEGYYATTVEGIWQGLKVFENSDMDEEKFHIIDMINIKRSERKFGKVLGHRKGIFSKDMLDYKTARKDIYIKTYEWVLENLLTEQINDLRQKALKNDLILLDYTTNLDINDLSKPLSHAGLVKSYLELKFPELKENKFTEPDDEKRIISNKQKGRKTNYNELSVNKNKIKARKKKTISTNLEQIELFDLRNQSSDITIESPLKKLISYCQEKKRICPMPVYWNELWEKLKDRKRKNGGYEPAAPLILAAWYDAPALMKQLRLIEHLEWADKHLQLEEISKFLHGLKEEQWFHLGE